MAILYICAFTISALSQKVGFKGAATAVVCSLALGLVTRAFGALVFKYLQ